MLIEQLLDQINQMKGSFHAWVERTETGAKSSGSIEMPAAANENGENVDHLPENEGPSHVAKIPMYEDESYFMSYAHFDIHYDMLSVSTMTMTTFCEKKVTE